MKKKTGISRREFLKNASMAAVGSTFLIASGGKKNLTEEPVRHRATVVLVRDTAVLDSSGQPVFEVVLRMLDQGITTLMGEKNPVDCWKKILKKDDIVGIKSNVWRFIPTTAQVENAIKKRIMDAGIPENRIGVGDRGILRQEIFKYSTALINARPMRSHHWSGVGSLIKNYIMFVPRPQEYHPDSCADLATIWKLPIVKDKTRLNILVMFTPQFHGVGPHNFNPRYIWKYHGMIIGFDPVAVDSTGVRILQAKRKDYFGEMRPLNPPPKHVFLADSRHHLGTADPNKIKLIKLGYKENIFV
jgi:hypothetical protein